MVTWTPEVSPSLRGEQPCTHSGLVPAEVQSGPQGSSKPAHSELALSQPVSLAPADFHHLTRGHASRRSEATVLVDDTPEAQIPSHWEALHISKGQASDPQRLGQFPEKGLARLHSYNQPGLWGCPAPSYDQAGLWGSRYCTQLEPAWAMGQSGVHPLRLCTLVLGGWKLSLVLHK